MFSEQDSGAGPSNVTGQSGWDTSAGNDDSSDESTFSPSWFIEKPVYHPDLAYTDYFKLGTKVGGDYVMPQLTL